MVYGRRGLGVSPSRVQGLEFTGLSICVGAGMCSWLGFVDLDEDFGPPKRRSATNHGGSYYPLPAPAAAAAAARNAALARNKQQLSAGNKVQGLGFT